MKRLFNTHYITFVGFFNKKRYWFTAGIFWSIILFLNDPIRNHKYKWTISRYDSYESIDSVGGFSLFIWKAYYRSRGYNEKKGNISYESYETSLVKSWSPYQNY